MAAYDLNTAVTSISVPMTQLAARIDMKFTVDEELETVSTTADTKVTNQWFYTVTKLTVKNINQKSDLILLVEIINMMMLSLRQRILHCKMALRYLFIPMRS